jgi:hypothetical protein
MSNVLSEEEKTTSHGTGEARMARTAHRASHGYTSRTAVNSRRFAFAARPFASRVVAGAAPSESTKGFAPPLLGRTFPFQIEVIIVYIHKLFARLRFQHAPYALTIFGELWVSPFVSSGAPLDVARVEMRDEHRTADLVVVSIMQNSIHFGRLREKTHYCHIKESA